MRWRCRVLPIIAFLGLSGSFSAAHANQVLVSNLLPDGVVSANPLSPSQIDTSDFWAQEFTSGVSTNLVSIQASLGMLIPGANGGFSITAQLVQVNNASDAPDMGSVLGTLSQVGSISTTGYTNVEFDPTSTVSLDSSKYYCLRRPAPATRRAVCSGNSPTSRATSSGLERFRARPPIW